MRDFRDKEALPIGKVLMRYLREEGIESPLNEQRLLAAWPEVMGPMIASFTRGLFIKNQTLYVSLSSSVLRQELASTRDRIVKLLNRHVGAQVIANIVFH